MGLLVSKLYQLFEEWGNTPARILMLGLDAAGTCLSDFLVLFFIVVTSLFITDISIYDLGKEFLILCFD